MQIPLQITVRGMPQSDALDALIRERVARLERAHRGITRCRVTLAQESGKHLQGAPFEARVEVRVPGGIDIAATRQHDQDVRIALRDAFDAATRQLEDVFRMRRGEVKAHDAGEARTVETGETR